MNKTKVFAIGQLLLAIDLSILSSPVMGSAAISQAEDPSCAAQVASEAKKYDPSKLYGRYDKNEGAEELADLMKLIGELEALEAKNELNREYLFQHGVIRWRKGVVRDKTLKQAEPYWQLDIPPAFTGMYIPVTKEKVTTKVYGTKEYQGKVHQTVRMVSKEVQREYDPKEFDGILMLLPGIGFSVSTAKSQMEMGGTFTSGTNPALELDDGTFLRMLGVLTDAPLNGMAEHAPYIFGSPEAIVAIMRLENLIMRILYPGLDVVWGGRSQGGANVAEAASYFNESEVVGVVALNPSTPEPTLLAGTIKIHEDWADPVNAEKARKAQFDTNFHHLSWTAHRDWTPNYKFLERKSKVPVFVQLSNKDEGYPEGYLQHWMDWCSDQSGARRMYELYEGPHNLWMRPHGQGEERYSTTIRDVKNFVYPLLRRRRPRPF